MSEVSEGSHEKMKLKEKEILLVKMDDRYSAEQVTQIVNDVAQEINGEEQEFQTPVLFLDKSIELEKVSIDRLEDILQHAKQISEDGELNQEEVEFENEEMEGVEVEEDDQRVKMEDIPEELEELIPHDIREENNNQ